MTTNGLTLAWIGGYPYLVAVCRSETVAAASPRTSFDVRTRTERRRRRDRVFLDIAVDFKDDAGASLEVLTATIDLDDSDARDLMIEFVEIGFVQIAFREAATGALLGELAYPAGDQFAAAANEALALVEPWSPGRPWRRRSKRSR